MLLFLNISIFSGGLLRPRDADVSSQPRRQAPHAAGLRGDEAELGPRLRGARLGQL